MSDTEVVVIGAGAGGSFVATALAEAGVSVLLIDRGPWFDFTRDYPMRYPDWERRKHAFTDDNYFEDGSIELEKGPRIDPVDLDLCSRNDIGQLEKRTHRNHFYYQRVHGIGGSTLHYQGEAHRFPRHAFNPATSIGAGIDWPLSYNDIIPYYDKAEAWLGVAGKTGNPYKVPRGQFPTPAHPLSTTSQWVARGAESLGWKILPNTLALPSKSYDGRTPCQHSGGCTLGCPFGAKSSTDLAVLPRATKSGKLRVLDRTQVVELECNSIGKISAAVYVRDGNRTRVSADRFVIAAGAIETPRLLLASKSSNYPTGIGNYNDQVGRNLMETIFAMLNIEANLPIYSWKGPPIDARIWDFNHPGADSEINGFVLGVSGTMSGQHGPVSYARRIGGFGSEHKNAMRNTFGRVVSLFGIADHTPYKDNRVTLSDALDDNGMPKVRIESDYLQRDKRTLRTMIGRLIEWAEACEPKKIMNLYSTYSQSSATHLAGTCMMGNDPDTSVVDPYGQVHGVDNLFIADASVMPGQGMGDSPSLTIQALALRTADHMIIN